LLIIAVLISCDKCFTERDILSLMTVSVKYEADNEIILTGKLIKRNSFALDELGFILLSSSVGNSGYVGLGCVSPSTMKNDYLEV
jgi:hypothetical protein